MQSFLHVLAGGRRQVDNAVTAALFSENRLIKQVYMGDFDHRSSFVWVQELPVFYIGSAKARQVCEYQGCVTEDLGAKAQDGVVLDSHGCG